MSDKIRKAYAQKFSRCEKTDKQKPPCAKLSGGTHRNFLSKRDMKMLYTEKREKMRLVDRKVFETHQQMTAYDLVLVGQRSAILWQYLSTQSILIPATG